jgi:hypothetical protein
MRNWGGLQAWATYDYLQPTPVSPEDRQILETEPDWAPFSMWKDHKTQLWVGMLGRGDSMIIWLGRWKRREPRPV